MRYPLYDRALARLNDYEQSVANALEKYQPEWWLVCAHYQSKQDYIRASDDANRVSALVDMMRESVNQGLVFYGAISTLPGHGPAR